MQENQSSEKLILSKLFFTEIFCLLYCLFSLDPINSDFKKGQGNIFSEFSESIEKINHLLFMDDLQLHSHNVKGLDSLIQTILISGENKGMGFGIEKCTMIVIQEGKIMKSIEMELPDGKVIKSLQEGESYKYLGTLAADRVLGEEMKSKVSKEYFRRLRKVLKSKMNGGISVQGVNTWVVSLLRYLAAFIS